MKIFNNKCKKTVYAYTDVFGVLLSVAGLL